MKFETTFSGSIVIYIKTNSKGVPIQVETDKEKIESPYYVRYVCV